MQLLAASSTASTKSLPASPGRASGASQRRTSARSAARWRGYAGQLRRTNSDRSTPPTAANGTVTSSPRGAQVRGTNHETRHRGPGQRKGLTLPLRLVVRLRTKVNIQLLDQTHDASPLDGGPPVG